MGDALWEKVLVVAAVVVAAAFLGFAAKRELLDQHTAPSEESVQAVVSDTSDGEMTDTFSDVAGAERSADETTRRVRSARSERQRAATPVRSDRESCEELREVHNRTRSERAWYIDNCMFLARKAREAGQNVAVSAAARAEGVEAQLQAAGFSLEAPGPRRAAAGASAPPPPELTSKVAVSMAVEWIPENTPVIVSLGEDDCTPVWLNGHWVVTCNVTLDGCTFDYCVASLSVCVYPTEPMLVPDLLC